MEIILDNIFQEPPDYNLNNDQKSAANAFLEFLFSSDKEFIISGPAGTGKTFLMRYITDTTLELYYDQCREKGIEPKYFYVEMTAVTNKAAEVLSQATGRPTSTVHSFLNLVVTEDYKTGC